MKPHQKRWVENNRERTREIQKAYRDRKRAAMTEEERLADRERRRAHEAAYRERHRARVKERKRLWHQENAATQNAKTRANYMARTYGLTKQDWQAMFDAQGRKCAICHTDTPTTEKGWVTDHCHATGVVRGVLCHHCNVGLGGFKDNPAALANAVSYLSRFKAEVVNG